MEADPVKNFLASLPRQNHLPDEILSQSKQPRCYSLVRVPITGFLTTPHVTLTYSQQNGSLHERGAQTLAIHWSLGTCTYTTFFIHTFCRQPPFTQPSGSGCQVWLAAFAPSVVSFLLEEKVKNSGLNPQVLAGWGNKISQPSTLLFKIQSSISQTCVWRLELNKKLWARTHEACAKRFPSPSGELATPLVPYRRKPVWIQTRQGPPKGRFVCVSHSYLPPLAPPFRLPYRQKLMALFRWCFSTLASGVHIFKSLNHLREAGEELPSPQARSTTVSICIFKICIPCHFVYNFESMIERPISMFWLGSWSLFRLEVNGFIIVTQLDAT